MSKKARTTDFEPDDFNLNEHTERGGDMLETSLQKTGVVRPIAVDKNGKVITGNATQQAAVNIGIEDAIIVKSDGTKLIVHQRTDLDLDDQGVVGEQTRLASILDNRVAEVNLKWNTERLSKLRIGDEDSGIVPMEGLRQVWTNKELDAMGVESVEPPEDQGAQVDKAAELQEQWQVERGDLWMIGGHRLLCGDSTDADDVARVMAGERAQFVLTDPPYGVRFGKQQQGAYYNGKKGHRRKAMAGDEVAIDAIGIIESAINNIDGDCLFIWHSPLYSGDMKTILERFGWTAFCIIAWVKNIPSFAAINARYKPRYELATVAKRDTIPWYGPNNETTAWEIDKPSVNEYHPTQKPVELFARAISNHTQAGHIVLDPFGGSGTTMVACEQLKRTCRMIEIEPKYCAVVLQRMSDLGLEPHK